MFLKNCWHAAALAPAAGRIPLARIFLDEPVAVFRTEAGAPVAKSAADRGLTLACDQFQPFQEGGPSAA